MSSVRLAPWALVLASALLAGCQRGMYDQPRYEPLEESADGDAASRHLVPNTVFRRQMAPDDRELRTNNPLYTGQAGGQPVSDFPISIELKDLERGQERFKIYCSMCHGLDGHGEGMVVKRGFRQPPDFHNEAEFPRLHADTSVGHIFDVVTNGNGAMPSYAHVPLLDRWKIVAYVKALQRSQRGSLEDVKKLAPQEIERLDRLF